MDMKGSIVKILFLVSLVFAILGVNSLVSAQTYSSHEDRIGGAHACYASKHACASATANYSLAQNTLSKADRASRAKAATLSGECSPAAKEGQPCSCFDGTCAGVCHQGRCDPDR